MSIGGGWRWFRRRPPVVQAAVALAVLAGYSLLLVALFAGGDDAPEREAATTQPERPMTPQEREITSIVTGVDVKASEPTDVKRFRTPTNARTRCEGDSCEIVYSIGLPGRGRILEDQRQIWTALFGETDVQRATITVLRDHAAAGVPPKEGEESASGAELLRTTCDRSRAPGVDWTKRSGAELLQRLCDVTYLDGRSRREQEPVAPDDPAAGGAQEEGR